MRLAVLRVLALGLWRDRGALVMSFVLPGVVFLVFAAILAGATGDDLRLRVVVADERGDALSARLAAALGADRSLRQASTPVASLAAVEAAVAAGTADVGVLIRRDGRALDDLLGEGPTPVLVVTHPARAVAGAIVGGAVQRAYFSTMPDVALRGVVALVDAAVVELTPEQKVEADAALTEMASNLGKSGTTEPAADAFGGLVEVRASAQSRGALDQVTYYAAAVSALFVLLSAVHTASSLHDDREAGIVDRVLAGPAGSAALIDGRALFLIVQGSAQALVVFAVAWVTYARQWPGAMAGWLLMTVSLAAAAAGLTLLVSALCRTSRQAQTASNVLILVASAVGGSMVPRYLMPPWLQTAGWLSPNAWAIEGYTHALAGEPMLIRSVVPAVVLLAVGAVGWGVARNRAAAWETV